VREQINEDLIIQALLAIAQDLIKSQHDLEQNTPDEP